MAVRIGFIKVGNIGTSPLLELLLDERADREDIDVRVVSSGAKLTPEQAEEVARKALEFSPSLVIVASPSAGLPGPSKVRAIVKEAGVPGIAISDAPAKKAIKKIEEDGFGYIIVEADAMIGARREFLDPAEMALFNADVIKVLAATGAFNVVCEELDKVIEALKKGEKPELPKVVIDAETAAKAAGFSNPYAMAKAMAAYEMAKKVADITSQACFVVKEPERYVPMCAAAHELMKVAAAMADEAREIEKGADSLLRKPHAKDGRLLAKKKLMEKPA